MEMNKTVRLERKEKLEEQLTLEKQLTQDLIIKHYPKELRDLNKNI